MAYCPKCNEPLEARATMCPHCGYDFPPDPDPVQQRKGFEYSPFADVALHIAAILSGFGALATVFMFVSALCQGQWMVALIGTPCTFFFALAMMIVFLRVQKM